MSNYDMRGFEEHCAREEAAIMERAREIQTIKDELCDNFVASYRDALDRLDYDQLIALYHESQKSDLNGWSIK